MELDYQTNPEVQQAADEATELCELADTFQVTTPLEHAGAGEELINIKTAKRNLENQRKKFTRPLDTAKKAVMDWFREPLRRLDQAERSLKRAMLTYQQEEARKRRHEQEKLEKAAERKRHRLAQRAAEAAESGDEHKAAALDTQASTVVAPVVPAQPKVSGVSTRENWKAEVTDLMALVKAVAAGDASLTLIQANTTEINKRARALKSEFSVPGIRVYAEQSLAARSAS